MPRVVVTGSSFAFLDIAEGILRPLGCEIVRGQCKTPELLIPRATVALLAARVLRGEPAVNVVNGVAGP